jgi:hypothetical protein
MTTETQSLREEIARTLFKRWKARSAKSIIEPAPGSYVLDEWEELPPSVQRTFFEDADALLPIITRVQGKEETGKLIEGIFEDDRTVVTFSVPVSSSWTAGDYAIRALTTEVANG